MSENCVNYAQNEKLISDYPNKENGRNRRESFKIMKIRGGSQKQLQKNRNGVII